MVDLGKHGTTITLILMFVMLISYSIEPIRVTVGAAMDVVFGPLVNMPPAGLGVPFFIVVLVLSALTGFYSSVVQKYTVDYEHQTDVQKRMKEFQKEYREAQLSQDEKKIKKLEGKKDKMMAEQLEMSREQFKPMAFILVLSVPIFFWLLFRLNDLNILRHIALPLIGIRTLEQAALGPIPAWILWYFICSITISQIIRKAMNIGGI
ncbi:MAG: EMC3/TMCO1 family protein [Methanomicrobiales archaeon]|nr:EMC3/TMCO1 family protein [Methanomicrobiales archaeon]